MKQIIKNLLDPGNYPQKINLILLLLRLSVGVFMLSHGLGKFSKLFGDEPIKFADPIGVGITPYLALAVFAEVLCSILLILGIATRLATVPLLTTMLVAAFIIHASDGFGKQELPLLYSLIYIVIAIMGAGKFSIDNWLSKRFA